MVSIVGIIWLYFYKQNEILNFIKLALDIYNYKFFSIVLQCLYLTKKKVVIYDIEFEI